MFHIRFATRILVIQALTVTLVVGVCTGIFTVLMVQQLKTEAEHTALAIARSVAVHPQVRQDVAVDTLTGANPSSAALATGPLQGYAREASISTGALFIVITDGNGIRLAHPEPQRLGQTVSTSFAAAMRGQETTAWETGTLGDSARAKVPIFAPESTTPVGEVSVGFERESVYDRLPQLLLAVVVGAILALTIGVAVALMMRRRWEKITLGLQPEELVALVKNHTAVLDGVEEGVLALRPDGSIDVHNQQAQNILGAGPLQGRKLNDVGLDEAAVAALMAGQRPEPITHHDRILYLDSHQVRRGDRELGQVITIRDRTDILELSQRLDSVRTMTHALRAQRHEFANRIHTASGLLDAGRVKDAAHFLYDMHRNGGQTHPLIGAVRLNDPFLSSFLNTASIAASERGVSLRITEDTLILGATDNAEDIATILGNLINNATDAAIRGTPPRWIDLTLMDAGDTLAITIADSGTGIAEGVDVFVAGPGLMDDGEADEGTTDQIHGHGIGLKLCRALARSHGGDIWVIDHGRPTGAVFGVQLPGVMMPPDAYRTERKEKTHG